MAEVARVRVDGDGPLSVYTTIRPNYGLRRSPAPKTRSMWTANEESADDRRRSLRLRGSIVRLQEFDDEDGRAAEASPR
jgi:hypothetical protein